MTGGSFCAVNGFSACDGAFFSSPLRVVFGV